MPRTARSPVVTIPAIHPERDALLRAILATPDDDTPRLVYADWQEEHGQPEHAELIRVEREIDRIIRERRDETPLPPHEAALWARRTRLYRSRPLRFDGYGDAVYFSGGDGLAVAHIRAKKRRGPADGHNLLTWWPGAPLRVPLDRVLKIALYFNRHADADLIAAVAETHWLWRVFHVVFEGARLGPGALEPLAASGRLTGLQSVWFRGGSIDAADLARLALAESACQLTDVLLLDGCRATAGADRRPSPEALVAAVTAMGAAPRANQFVRLSLESPEAGNAVAQALLDAAGFDRLEYPPYLGRRLRRPIREALEARFDELRFPHVRTLTATSPS